MAYSSIPALLLLFYFPLILPRAAQGLSDKASSNERQDLDRTEPSPDDVSRAGDTSAAEWEKAVISVSSCSQEEDADAESDCGGGSVWPEVAQDGDNYSFILEISDIETSSAFYLRMIDDFGNTMQSPSFSFDPSAQSLGSAETVDDDLPSPSSSDRSDEDNSSQDADDEPDSLEGSSPQAPLNKPGSDNSQAPSDLKDPMTADSDLKEPQTTLSHASGTFTSGSSRTKATSSSIVSHTSISESWAMPTATAGISSSPNLKSDGSNNNGVPSPQGATLRRAPVPTAAIAVPVSLVGATLLISLVLFFMRRRSLAAQRSRNGQIIDIHRSRSVKTVPSLSTTASGRTIVEDADIEKAIDELAGGRALSHQSNLERDPSVGYVPASARYQASREVAQGELSKVHSHAYDDWSSQVDRSHTSKFSRAHSDRHLGSLSTELVRDYRRSQSFLQGFGRSARRYPRRPNQIRFYRRSRDQGEDDEAPPAGGVFPGCLSPPNLSRRDSNEASLRLPLRSHSKPIAPEMRDNQHRH